VFGKIVERIEQALSHPAFFYVGLAIWLVNAVLSSTFAWLFVPGSISRLLRYISLGVILLWSMSQSRSRLLALPAYAALAAGILLLTRSTRAVRYSFVLLIPLGELFGTEGIKSTGAWIRFVVSAILVVISSNAESVWLLDTSIMILAAGQLDFHDMAMVALAVTATLVAGTILCASLGVTHDYIMDAGVGTRLRHFMGFGYALYPARYLFLIICLTAYLSKEKFGLLEASILLLADVAIYKLTDSKLACYSSAMLVVAAVVLTRMRKNPLDSKAIRTCVVALVPVCAVTAIILALVYDPSVHWMQKLNAAGVLSGRLRLGHDALASMGIPLLGQKIELVGNGLVSVGKAMPSGSYNYVDSIYIQVLVKFGPIVWLLFVGLQTAVLFSASRRGELTLVVILLLFVLQGTIDDAPLMFQYNTFLLISAPIVSSDSLSTVAGRLRAVIRKRRGSDERATIQRIANE